MRTVALVGESLGVLLLALMLCLSFMSTLDGRQDPALAAVTPYRNVAGWIMLTAAGAFALYVVRRWMRHRAWPLAALGVVLTLLGILVAGLPL